MLSKWSCKPADYQAARQRENQRRHRQKVKDHVADLESRLSHLQLELDVALSRVEELTRALEFERAPRQEPILLTSQNPPERSCTPAYRSDEQTPTTYALNGDPQIQPVGNNVAQHIDSTSRPSVSHVPVLGPSPILSSPCTTKSRKQAETETDAEAFIDLDLDDHNACDWPPLEPGRPTTHCRDAYLIIARQNYKRLDNSTIQKWLEPGFRRETAKDDGCRVDTVLLFTLLDLISSS